MIIGEIKEGVCIFEKSKPTCLATDWSKTGIGFWLFQKHCRCPSTEPFCCQTGWDPIKVATVSDTNVVQLISIIESGFPEFHHELSPPVHSGWHNTLKSTHSHPTLPSPVCPHHPSFGTRGPDLHDCM